MGRVWRGEQRVMKAEEDEWLNVEEEQIGVGGGGYQ